jgi:hypothetical protein
VKVTDVHLHFVNTLIALLDLCVTRLPFLITHIWMPFIYLLSYLIFATIYFFAGGRGAEGLPYIYAPLNFRKPVKVTVAVILVLFVFYPAIYVGLWLLNRLCDHRLRWSHRQEAATQTSQEPGLSAPAEPSPEQQQLCPVVPSAEFKWRDKYDEII